MARVDDLRADYERLGEVLKGEEDGSKAAALARERRLIGELLESLEAPKGVTTVVDQLESRRRARTGAAGAPSRRRKSG